MAVGQFEASEMIAHSFNQDDFMDVEPSLT